MSNFLGQRRHHSGSYHNFAAFSEDQDDSWQDEWDDWSHAYQASQWDDDDWSSGWWDDEAQQLQAQSSEQESPAPTPDDDALREAQQAERMAENLAMEATRTWTEAQRATQQLRKDRGFGAPASHGGSSSARCFNCGGNHFSHDCPDRRHPSFGVARASSKAIGLKRMTTVPTTSARARASPRPKARRATGLKDRQPGRASRRERLSLLLRTATAP